LLSALPRPPPHPLPPTFHISFVISRLLLLHHNHFRFFRFKFGLHIAMHYHGPFCFLLCFHMIINNSSLFISNLNLILININIMNMKKYKLILSFHIVPSAQVLPRLQQIFLSKTWFFGNLFEFSNGKNHFKNQYLPHSESKSYQINSIKSCSSRSFQERPHSNSSKIFSSD
jgi:hypothetical protein